MIGNGFAGCQEIIVALMVVHNMHTAYSGQIIEMNEADIQRYRNKTTTINRDDHGRQV